MKIITLLLIFIATSYHTGALLFKSESEKLLKNLRYRNALYNIVLKSSNNIDGKIITTKLKQALNLNQIALQFYPGSGELHQLSGEINYLLNTLANDNMALAQGIIHYQSCHELEPYNPFCSQRLHLLQRMAQTTPLADKIKVDNDLMEDYLRHDPFQLLTHGQLYPY